MVHGHLYRPCCNGSDVNRDGIRQQPARGRTACTPTAIAGHRRPWLSKIRTFFGVPLGDLVQRTRADPGTKGPSTLAVYAASPKNAAFMTAAGRGVEMIRAPLGTCPSAC